MTNEITRATRRKPARGPGLSDLETRLIAAAVTVPVFCVIFLLVLQRDLALTACALMFGSAAWLCASGWLARRRGTRRAAKPRRSGARP